MIGTAKLRRSSTVATSVSAEAHPHDADRGRAAIEQPAGERSNVEDRLAETLVGDARIAPRPGRRAAMRRAGAVERERRDGDVHALLVEPLDRPRALLDRVVPGAIAVQQDRRRTRPIRMQKQPRRRGVVELVLEIARSHIRAVELEAARPRPVHDLAPLQRAHALGLRRDGRGRREERRVRRIVLGSIVEIRDLGERRHALGVPEGLGSRPCLRGRAAVEDDRARGAIDLGGGAVEDMAEHG
jgi:hypothetical protein